MIVFSINTRRPENGSKCLVWMGDWWRDVTYYTHDHCFYTGDGDRLNKEIELWFYAPKPEESQLHGT